MNTEPTTLLAVSYDGGFFRMLQLALENERRPYHVLKATNAPDALRIFKKSKPDLVLASNELAEDQQLLKQIRTLPAGKDVPFVIICNSYDEEVLSDLGKQGAYIIITPYRPKEVLSVIQSCLGEPDAQSE